MPRLHSVMLAMSLAFLAACGQDRQEASAPTAASPVTPAKTESPERAVASTAKPLPDNGHTTAVPADANPQAASVAEALRTQTHPERLTPMVAPLPFDPVAYAKDPKPYLSVTEPGRVFDTAAPTATTPVLRPVTATTASVAPGGTVRLAVRTAPGAPVSWLSTDLGSFDNRLVSMTVASGADGIAEAHFTATPGVAGRVTIQAGSPLASGQVRFVLEVQASPITAVPVTAGPASN